MKTILVQIAVLFLKITLPLRYRIKVKGLEEIKGKKGLLFLSNHPAEIDPVILMALLWKPFQPRPVVLDTFYHDPFLATLFRWVKSIPLPNFEISSNSFKLKQMEKVYSEIDRAIERGENILIYPSGRLKRSAEESIGGASGVHHLVQRIKDPKVILVRITGLWGSVFSYAITGKRPPLFSTFLFCTKVILKNLFFFIPRREVVIEFSTPHFPIESPKREFNRALEKWYNEPEEPLKLISYSFWKKELLQPIQQPEKTVKRREIPDSIRNPILQEIVKLSKIPLEQISEEKDLSYDLGLDSLDQAQLLIFLKEQFGKTSIQLRDFQTVGDLFDLAIGEKKPTEEDKGTTDTKAWFRESARTPEAPQGSTIIEAFLLTSKRIEDKIACSDPNGGIFTYKKFRLAVILLAKKLETLPDQRIGILLPASAAVNILILATHLANKVPVMINWTLGPRNLHAVLKSSGVQKTISSWKFLDRLENFDLDGFDDHIILLEDLKRSITLKEKLAGIFLSKKSVSHILKSFNFRVKENDPAVILYTSGTESLPKGVPLTHHNILSNQGDAFKRVSFEGHHIFLGALPPFHSFGFSVTGLFPLLTGLKVSYYPNPTDGRALAKAIEKWGVTILCLAPTFLKNLFRVATPLQLKSLEIVIAGAEKTSPEIYEKLHEINPKIILAEGYGITECSPILTINPFFGKKKGVGLPLPSCELMIVHPETLEPLPKNEEGLILASGPNVFSGYITPEKSPFIERDGKKWYHTGDLGRIDEEGYLTLSGRLKRFVKIGGEMISLGAIEEALLANGKKEGWPLAEDVPSLAVSFKEEDGKKAMIALFTTFPLSLEQANLVLKNEGMSNLIRLSSVKEIPLIPLLGTGKIDYRTLNSKW